MTRDLKLRTVADFYRFLDGEINHFTTNSNVLKKHSVLVSSTAAFGRNLSHCVHNSGSLTPIGPKGVILRQNHLLLKASWRRNHLKKANAVIVNPKPTPIIIPSHCLLNSFPNPQPTKETPVIKNATAQLKRVSLFIF